MDWLIFGGVLVVLVALGFLAQHKGWIDLSNKSAQKRSGGTSPLTIGDEIFHPAHYEAQLEQDRQARMPIPAPVPDGDRDVYKGNVRIDLR